MLALYTTTCCLGLSHVRSPARSASVRAAARGHWGELGGCSKSCGGGWMQRRRSVNEDVEFGGKSCANRYSVGDVFYSEACLLRRICRNGDMLFKLERGAPFACDVDEEQYRDVVKDLLRTALNIDTRVEDYYSRRQRRAR